MNSPKNTTEILRETAIAADLKSVKQWNVLSTLAYYQVFNHPLSLEEIWRFCRIENKMMAEIEEEVKSLINKGLVYENQGFYFLDGDDGVVERRLKNNARAQKRMKVAWRHSRIIINCPFVEAVMISGSMSKGVLDADGDVDFFIVTQPGRLWIARVLLTLFKRIFLLNSYKNFCLNYFVDSEHLEIPDQNVFTATEVALIMPMFNDELYKIFLEQNLWYKQYYPNIEPMQHTKTSRKSVLSRWFEALLGEKMADNLDDYFMKLTRRYLKRKYSHLSPDQFESDLMSTKSVSRHHPERQQYRIIQKYEGIKAELRSKLAENG